MSFSEINRVIELVGKDRGIKKEVVIQAIEHAFLVTARKKFGIQGDYETKYNAEEDEVDIFQYKLVVDNVRDPIIEISFDDAQKLEEGCEVGDQLGLRIENPQFSRVDIQTAKQIIFQKVRDAERELLFSEFKHREGDLITGIARRFEKGNVIVDLGKAEAILSRRELIPGETFKPGDRIQAYLSEVVMTNRGPEIRLTRTSPLFLVKLFETEVPEIQDETIEVKAAAREPGHRAKIAVFTKDREIDPVGACVGLKGSRVQNIVNELQGEKIDIVHWSDNLETFIQSALSPAEITSIMLNNENNTMDVVVEDTQLSLAIGRRGQNVRLASMLSNWKINIISKTKLHNKVNASVENLTQLSGINSAIAQVFVQSGIMNIEDFCKADKHNLSRLSGLQEEQIDEVLTEIENLRESGSLKEIVEEEDIVSASAIPGRMGYIASHDGVGEENINKDKFSDAEKRLREELAAFKLK